jgi:hypothetical protein
VTIPSLAVGFLQALALNLSKSLDTHSIRTSGSYELRMLKVSDAGIAAVSRLGQLHTLVLTGCHQVTTDALSDLCHRYVAPPWLVAALTRCCVSHRLLSVQHTN